MFVWLTAILCLLSGVSDVRGLFLSDDSCLVALVSKPGDGELIHKHVPDRCHSGTFQWGHPMGTVFLYFTNSYDRPMAVCVKDDVNGNIFTVRDFTIREGSPSVIGRKESCTMQHRGHVILRLDAPSMLFPLGSLMYNVYTY